jgi:hypothetical protein
MKKYIRVCCDEPCAMTAKHSVVVRIKEVAPHAKCVHCGIHREALAARRIPAILKTVLAEDVKVVNFIKSGAMNSRLFSILCNEMGSEHDKLLLHIEVRWLSCVKPPI